MGACEILNDYLGVATLYEAKALRIMGMGKGLKPASALTAAGLPNDRDSGDFGYDHDYTTHSVRCARGRGPSKCTQQMATGKDLQQGRA